MLLLQLREKRPARLAFSGTVVDWNPSIDLFFFWRNTDNIFFKLLWNICVKICNLEQMIAIVKKPWHRPIMGVARYGLLVSDRIIMNLDGTQNNGSTFLAFFSEVLSFRKKISYSLCRRSVSSFLRSRFSCSVSRVRFWRFQHPQKKRLGTNCS